MDDTNQNKINCPSCGNEFKAAIGFCPSCGREIESGDRTAQMKRDRRLRDALVIVLSLIVFGAGFLIFSKKPVSAEREFTHPDIPGMPPGQSPDMEKILATLPGDYDELVNLGNHYMDNGIYALAIECYRRALAIDSTDPNVMVDLGACSHAVGNLAEAITYFKKALQLDPDHAIAHFNLGIAYTGLGEMNEARKHWKKYVEIAPESPLADTVRKYIENLDN